MKLLPFDTETTGVPDWQKPSHFGTQPHMVQLAAILCDEAGNRQDHMNVIIKPEGWDIPPDMTAIHGISFERAMDEGIPEKEALMQFMHMFFLADLRIAHNTTFDNRIIRIALKRYAKDLVSDESWKDRNRYYCTHQAFRKLVGGKDGHTLADAYKYFFKEDMQGAHNAWNDTENCLAVYLAMNPPAVPL